MVTGWKEIDEKLYYFTESEGPDNGVLKTGWFTEDGNNPGDRWYYAKTEEDVEGEGGNIGEIFTGKWTNPLNGNEYYFVEEDGNGRKKGELFTGWHKEEDENGNKTWYYYSKDTSDNGINLGKMLKDWVYVLDEKPYNDKTTKFRRYYLDKETGAMHTSWFDDESGAKYFLSDRNRGKFTEGEMVVGWVEIDGDFYYFHEDGDKEGQMAKNEIVNIGGQTYYFGEDGMRIEVLEELEKN